MLQLKINALKPFHGFHTKTHDNAIACGNCFHIVNYAQCVACSDIHTLLQLYLQHCKCVSFLWHVLKNLKWLKPNN